MLSIDQLLLALLDRDGSDLHVMAGHPPTIRVNGELVCLDMPAPSSADVEQAIYAILSPGQIKNFCESPTTRCELDFGYGLQGVGRFRINIHRQRGSIAAVFRAIPHSIPPLESLSLPQAVNDLTTMARGLVLVTGPTGSGKSTTLAAIIDKINQTRAAHIITIEDPIEYLHRSQKSLVTQRDVGDSGDTLSFKNALKYSLRQDPNVIMVGEMRDYETIGIALTAAETGHVVFGTLHTSSAAQTVSRIIDVFPADRQQQVATQLSATLVAVVCQNLLTSTDGNGRVPAVEVMRGTPAVRSLIRENKVNSINQAIETGTSVGMISMDRAVLQLVETGAITAETAMPHLTTQHAFQEIARYLEAA